MQILFEILLAALATFGLYALLSRIAVWLTRKEDLMITVSTEGRSPEEILLLAALMRLRAEEDASLSERVGVYMASEDPVLEAALRKEGVIILEEKKETNKGKE